MTIDRYISHTGIQGWSEELQEKLLSSSVAVIGAGFGADITAICLQGLGFGTINLVRSSLMPDYDRGFLKNIRNIESTSDNCTVAKNILNQINPSTKVYEWSILPTSLNCLSILPFVDVVVEASCDKSVRYVTAHYCRFSNIPLVSAYSDTNSFSLSVINNSENTKVKDSLRKREFTALMSLIETSPEHHNSPSAWAECVSAGLAAEEARKLIVPFGDECTLEKTLSYKSSYESDSSENTSGNSSANHQVKNPDIFIAGAGSLGTFASLVIGKILSDKNAFGTVTIADFDSPETRNLNRQFFYSGRSGLKSALLAHNLAYAYPDLDFKWINGIVADLKEFRKGDVTQKLGLQDSIMAYPSSDGIVEPAVLSSKYFSEHNFSIYMGCFDNQIARYSLSSLAIKARRALVDGGSAAGAGNAYLQLPWKNSCRICQSGFQKSQILQKVVRASCSHNPIPSVITTNAIVAGWMVKMAYDYLSGNVTEDTFRYSSAYSERIETQLSAGRCKHYSTPV